MTCNGISLLDCKIYKSSRDLKVGHSDPIVFRGLAIAQRIKGTPGITGWWPPRVLIDGAVWHLDVDSSHPGAESGSKGSAVRRLKWYVSWVQNVVRQFGPYLLVNRKNKMFCPSTRGLGWLYPWCLGYFL